MKQRRYPDGSEKLEDGITIYDRSFLDNCHPKITKIFELWLSKTSDGHLPSRKEFDPLEMVDLLPYIFMVDKNSPTKEFRYRLIGTEEVLFRGNDPTGKLVREACAAENVDDVLEKYEYLFREKKPIYNLCRFDGRRHIVEDQAVFLPLATDGSTVDMVLGLGIRIEAGQPT
ncbi:MAG: PAS domain-containing protein [Alphaproteobacteria bacterium]|nr:PAS domain-containing protein [Alphaproteobacteria bacterium]